MGCRADFALDFYARNEPLGAEFVGYIFNCPEGIETHLAIRLNKRKRQKMLRK